MYVTSSSQFQDPEGASTPGAQQVGVAFLPIFHIAGLMGYAIMYMVAGMKVVVISRYSTTKLLQVIQDYKVFINIIVCIN